MNFLHRLSSFAWVLALIGAGGFLLWINAARSQRVEFISGLAGPTPGVDTTSPTGYAAGLRRMIAPEHNNDSYQWIAQTQQMLARGEWHVRHVEYDNAPSGRDVYSSSLYRWWLGLCARLDHLVSHSPLGLDVERATLFADPLLHLLFLIGAVVFTVRHFGNFSAVWLTIGLTVAFPMAGAFLPGQPNDHGLGLICAWWSVLPLLAGINLLPSLGLRPDEATRIRRRVGRLFFLAGLAGGIGIWVGPSRQVPILIGIVVGGILASWLTRRSTTNNPAFAVDARLWRVWSLAGAGTVLVAYLLEYFPDHLSGLRLEMGHPLYGLGWLGAAELLGRISALIQRKQPAWNRREIIITAIAVLAVATVPVLMLLTDNRGFLSEESLATQLTNLPESAIAPTFWAWIYRDGFTALGWATTLPLLWLIPAISRLFRREINPVHQTTLALALGPVVLALSLACFQLRWWNMLDIVLFTLVVVLVSRSGTVNSRLRLWLWSAGLTACLAPGLVLLITQVRSGRGEAVNEGEVRSLIERDLAHWLANQSGTSGAVVLAPPNLTTALFFHGGLAGLGTPYAENKDGFAAAVRIAGATSPDEAQAVAHGRGLAYIIIPSWDPFLDEYARLGSGHIEHSLIDMLHHWLPPRWLQPMPYHSPKIPGFESQSVIIFKVVEVQDNATALSHLAEYFIEMEQIDQAAAVGQALERLFPTELSALVARALVEKARGNPAGLTQVVAELAPYLKRGDEHDLPWDRRVSLAIALTEGKKYELARVQVQRCLAEADEPRLRSLTTVSLYRLQLMSKGFKLSIADPRLRELARTLLPVEYRDQL